MSDATVTIGSVSLTNTGTNNPLAGTQARPASRGTHSISEHTQASENLRPSSCHAAVFLLVAVVLIAGVVTGVLLFDDRQDTLRELAESHTRSAAAARSKSLGANLQLQLGGVVTFGGVAEVDERGNVRRWEQMASTIFNSMPGARSVGAIRYVLDEDRAAYEVNASYAYGAPAPMLDETGTVLEAVYPDYNVLTHRYPPRTGMPSNKLTAPGRRETLDIMRNGTALLVTGPRFLAANRVWVYAGYTPLLWPNGDYWGMLSYTLLYEEILATSLCDAGCEEIGVHVVDVTNDAELYSSGPLTGDVTVSEELNYGGNVWRVEYYTSETAAKSFDHGGSVILVVTAVLITAFLAFVVIFTAVVVRRQARKQELEAVVSLSEQHQQVLAYVCHEMRNPLHAVLGNLALAMEELDLEGGSQDLSDCVISAHLQSLQLQGVLDNVLDYRAIQSGDVTVKPSLADVPPVLTSMAQHYATVCQDKDIRVLASIHMEPPNMWVDIARLRQVVSNGLYNAFTYTSQGEIHLIANLREVDGAWYLLVEVRNTGARLPATVADWAASLGAVVQQSVPGSLATVPACEASSLREVAATTNVEQAAEAQLLMSAKSGFGLQLSHKIISRMGGTMNIADSVVDGVNMTVMRLLLPVRPVDLDDSATKLSQPSPRHRAALAGHDLPPRPKPSKQPSVTAEAFRMEVSAGGGSGSGAGSSSGHGKRQVPSLLTALAQPRATPAQGAASLRQITASLSLEEAPLVVLVVDEDPSLREMLQRFINRSRSIPHLLAGGAHVRKLYGLAAPASTPRAPQSIGSAEDVNVILLSITMDRDDGIEVCKALRASGLELPIYAMAGDSKLEQTCRAAGFTGLLVKPFDRPALDAAFSHGRGLLFRRSHTDEVKGEVTVLPTDITWFNSENLPSSMVNRSTSKL